MPVLLCVAEKPSVARGLREIMEALPGAAPARVRQGRASIHPVFEIDNVDVGRGLGRCRVVMTSVRGHLRELEFVPPFDKWSGCVPGQLFSAPVETRTGNGMEDLEHQLQDEARRADALMLWTDGDREGEAIGFEIVDVCRAVKPQLRVLRAKFSALLAPQVAHALAQPADADKRQADAVRARSEIDLRVGSAFTRMQTMALQSRFDELETKIVSYGPCQMPTLGFVVERFNLMKGFSAEKFWAIELSLAAPADDEAPLADEGDAAGEGDDGGNSDDNGGDDEDEDEEGGGPSGAAAGAARARRIRKPKPRFSGQHRRRSSVGRGGAGVVGGRGGHGGGRGGGHGGGGGGGGHSSRRVAFSWQRGRVFDKTVAEFLFDKCDEAPHATVASVAEREELRRRPVPMSTITLQTKASTQLRINSKNTMELAEELYNEGWLSYPRTVTECFKEGTDLEGLVRLHTGSPHWGAFADSLVNGGKFLWPTAGAKDDNAHPPIHPLRLAQSPQNFKGHEKEALWKIYELVTRHFLACCGLDAVGSRTTVHCELGGEVFTASGLVIRERNWFEVMPRVRWGDGSVMPAFAVGQTVAKGVLELALHEGETQPPTELAESDLLKAMDLEGIGTDATMAAHIDKIKEREYATQDPATTRFTPTKLGLALVAGYEALDLPLAKSHLRANMERACGNICSGDDDYENVVRKCLRDLEPAFRTCVANLDKLVDKMKEHFSPLGAGMHRAELAPALSVAGAGAPVPPPAGACAPAPATDEAGACSARCMPAPGGL